MQDVKKDRELKTDARGFVRKTLASTHVVADVTSDWIRPSMDESRPIDGLMQGVLDRASVRMLLLLS
jgi:MoxR-like ATPase